MLSITGKTQLRPTLVLGGPGCGKTTALLDLIESAMSQGVPIERIAYVTFTRKAANEARARIARRFDIEDAPFFRTLHSFAFHQLGVNRARMLTPARMQQYADAEGVEIGRTLVDNFGQIVARPSTGDEKALHAIALARLRECSFDDAVAAAGARFDTALRVKQEYDAFITEEGLLDFTGLLERYIETGTCPNFDLLLVDEAQDLSRLQWRMVSKLIDNSKEVFIAGDDDQAIYEWAGADLKHFRSLDADKHVLPTTWRLKSNIFDRCIHLLDYLDGYVKNFTPAFDGGEVAAVRDLADLDLGTGEWLLLARTHMRCGVFRRFLRAEGFPYYSMGREKMVSSIENSYVRAALVYESLRKGNKHEGRDVAGCRQLISPSYATVGKAIQDDETYGFADLGVRGNDPWFQALRLPGEIEQYIRALRRRGESLTRPPRITVSTIHGAKGGEAENVVIFQGLDKRTNTAWLEQDEQEFRTLYVGMSRARERLFFLDAKGKRQYHAKERVL